MLLFHKLLPALVLPLGIVTLLVLLGLRRQWRWLGAVGVLVLLVCSLPVTGNHLIGALESASPRLTPADTPAADAVLVLGGILGPVSAPGQVPDWTESVERFEGGVALLLAGRAERLVFTAADRLNGDGSEPEGAALRTLAIARGVPAERIIVSGPVTNTADEARELARLAAGHGWKRVILVTSAWHLPRALRQFDRSGVEIVPFPVDYRSAPRRRLAYMDFIPSANGLVLTELALRESYGSAFYAVFGR